MEIGLHDFLQKEHELLAEALLEHETLSIDEVNELLEHGKLLSRMPKAEKGPKCGKPTTRHIYKSPNVIIKPVEEAVSDEERI